MKIVVNKCYGGFSLSAAAVKRLAELQGKECYFFDRENNPISDVVAGYSYFWAAYSVSDPGFAPLKRWAQMSREERRAHCDAQPKVSLTNRPGNRADPLLVQVVEDLGKDSGGRHSKLEVVEIPDDVDWEIQEYDGYESIHEKHRSW